MSLVWGVCGILVDYLQMLQNSELKSILSKTWYIFNKWTPYSYNQCLVFRLFIIIYTPTIISSNLNLDCDLI